MKLWMLWKPLNPKGARTGWLYWPCKEHRYSKITHRCKNEAKSSKAVVLTCRSANPKICSVRFL